jgi:hypothetical protein
MDEYENPEVVRLMREGFEAFQKDVPLSASPYEPSHTNYWWCHGWDAALVAKLVGVQSR